MSFTSLKKSNMRCLKYIFLFLLFQPKLKAEIITTENDVLLLSFSEQDFQEQTQETKWLGLLYFQEELTNQNHTLFLECSSGSLIQNFSEELCSKSVTENLESSFQLDKNSKSHQLELEEVNRFFTDDTDLVDAWSKLFDAPDAIRKNIDLLEDVTNWPKSWKITKSGDGMVIANGSGKQLGTIYSNKIVAPARKISGESGNALLNRVPLVKNMKYDADGFIYETDELGRVLRTDADLDDVVRIRLGN